MAVRKSRYWAYKGRTFTEYSPKSTKVKIFPFKGLMPMQMNPAITFLSVTAKINTDLTIPGM